MTLRLITIGFSHYCEKARWALDRAKLDYVEESYAPLFHFPAARRAGGKSVPILIDTDTGEAFRDSTDIIAEIDRRRPDAGLIPTDPALRAEALAIEDDLDENLGPATRRVGYYFIVNRGGARFGREMIAGAAIGRSRALASVAYPAIAWAIAKSLKADEKGYERSLAKSETVFAGISARIDAAEAEGRRYLVGDRFSIADLTFAALCAPLLQPKNAGWPFPPRALLPAEAAALCDQFLRTPAGSFARRMYETERNAA
jgi:glutathione S-transferase